MKIKSNKVFINEEFVKASIEIENGVITKVSYDDIDVDIDYKDNKIIPGLVEIHSHGFKGMNFNYATEKGIIAWLKSLPYEGVTSVLPASSTANIEALENTFELMGNLNLYDYKNIANVLGIYIEGPFISFVKRGAQDPYNIQSMNTQLLEKWNQLSKGLIKLVCVAPEMPNADKFIKYCKDNKIKVSIGHSNAKYDSIINAAKEEIDSFTHTFNGMSQLTQREPGVAGAAMDLDNIYAELVGDGVHVHPAAARILAKCKGKDKLILVTDSGSLKGCQSGVYVQDGKEYFVQEDKSIKLSDGTICGNTQNLMEILRNAIVNMKIDEVTAINAVTINPLKMLGIPNKGLLKEGYTADIAVIDENYNVLSTMCNGIIIDKKGEN